VSTKLTVNYLQDVKTDGWGLVSVETFHAIVHFLVKKDQTLRRNWLQVVEVDAEEPVACGRFPPSDMHMSPSVLIILFAICFRP